MYDSTDWQDHVVDEQTGDVIQQGTPQSATNFNNQENGIQDAHTATAVFLQYFMQFDRWARQTVADHAAEFLNEIKTITLTNNKGIAFFNSQAQTVDLTTVRKTLNYDVSWEIVSANGNVGDITISDKLLNGFKIAFDGSATSVTLKIRIKGGMLV